MLSNFFFSPELLATLSAPLFLTLKVSLVSALGFCFLGVPLAYWCARRESVLSKAVLFLATLPLIFPPIALGYLLMLLLGQQGFFGSWAMRVFDMRLLFSEGSVFLAGTIAGMPLVVRPIKEVLSSARLLALEEAASVLGVEGVKRFRLITLPLIKNTLLASIMMGGCQSRW